ncbi:UNVERIFIED_CONTAM: hypothetical protein FKN15_037586 [Acipenser sinensis]
MEREKGKVFSLSYSQKQILCFLATNIILSTQEVALLHRGIWSPEEKAIFFFRNPLTEDDYKLKTGF